MPTSLLLTAVMLAAQAAGPVPHYRLTVQVNPDSHTIAVQGQMEGRSCEEGHRVYLNRHFQIKSFKVAGRTTPVRSDTAAPPAQWTEGTRPLVFDCRPGPIEFSYTGTIADTISDVNLVAPGLVELALYAGWYPRDPAVSTFTYDVDLELPAGWVLATGGRMKPSPASGSRQRIHFASAGPGMDLAFIASPDLVLQRSADARVPIEVYSGRADTALAVIASKNLQRAVALYGSWYGQVRTGGDPLPPRLVISPRDGWGYSRLPLILVPAGYTRQAFHQPLGEALVLQGTAHELAHFWWQIADTETPEDWINEGLAEFSAFTVARDLYGAAVRDTLAAAYGRSIARAKTAAPIAGTPNNSPDRYINHYQKPALLLAAVEAKVGPDRLHAFLASFYAAHAGRRDATTAEFLKGARDALGADVAAQMERCVTGAWAEDCAK